MLHILNDKQHWIQILLNESRDAAMINESMNTDLHFSVLLTQSYHVAED